MMTVEPKESLDLVSGMMCLTLILLGGMAMFDWWFYIKEWIIRKLRRWKK